MQVGCEIGAKVRGDNRTIKDVSRKQADPIGGVPRQADDLNSKPHVVVGNEWILEEVHSSRNARRNCP